MIYLNDSDKLEYASSGLFKSDDVWIHPKRIIDTFQIIFMYEGNAYLCEDGIEYVLKKNDVLLLEPGKEHFGFRASENFTSFFWLHYYTTCEKYTNLKKNFTLSDPSALKTLVSQCLHTVNTPIYDKSCGDFYTALILEELLYTDRTNCVPQNHLAAQIKEYVNLNVEKSISVSSIAKHFGYHENHISRIFRDTYGILLVKYITGKKIAYAENLLTTSLYTIGQLADMLSFKSENHFIKFFKYHTKMTPSQYRNAYTNTHINKK